MFMVCRMFGELFLYQLLYMCSEMGFEKNAYKGGFSKGLGIFLLEGECI